MYKIRKIQFIDHPILKNTELNFVGADGKAVDTVIFAGENGCGKSTIINELYNSILGQYVSSEIEYEIDGEIYSAKRIMIDKNSYNESRFDRNGEPSRVTFPAFSAIFQMWISISKLRIFLQLRV